MINSPNIPNIPDVQLSVVVPVYNEEDNIEPLVSEICSALDDEFRYEILYVDDGSNDRTIEVLQEIALKLSHLRIIRHSENYGQSTAMATGVRKANAKAIVTLDGDGQNDPADIPKLFNQFQKDAVKTENILIVGLRRKRRDSWLKRISSKVANAVRSRILKDGTPDTGSGLKVFSRKIFLELPFFDHMHRFLPALFIRNGGRVISIEVNHRERERGISKYGLQNRLWVGIIDMMGVVWLQKRGKLPNVEELSN